MISTAQGRLAISNGHLFILKLGRKGIIFLINSHQVSMSNLTPTIRPEKTSDEDTISNVIAAAFAPLDISSHTEMFIVAALRSSGALTLSLVAELASRIVGHIAFSPVVIADGAMGWYGIGPLSVLPAFQQRGIGKALMKAGLAQMKASGANGCCLVGFPQYYRKFGFVNPAGLWVEGVPNEVFFALSFAGVYPQGSVTFHQAFQATGPTSSLEDPSSTAS